MSISYIRFIISAILCCAAIASALFGSHLFKKLSLWSCCSSSLSGWDKTGGVESPGKQGPISYTKRKGEFLVTECSRILVANMACGRYSSHMFFCFPTNFVNIVPSTQLYRSVLPFVRGWYVEVFRCLIFSNSRYLLRLLAMKFAPLSVRISLGHPYGIMISSYRNVATALAVASGNAFATGQFVAWSMTTTIHMIPFFVLGSIPMNPSPTCEWFSGNR